MAYKHTEKCENHTLPLVPLKGAVFAFPGISVTIDISNPILKNAVEHAEKTSSPVYLITDKNAFSEKIDVSSLYTVGTVARVKQITKRGSTTTLATLEGICRAEHINIFMAGGYYSADIVVKELTYDGDYTAKSEALVRVIREKAKEIVSLYASPSKDLTFQFKAVNDIEFLSDLCGALILAKPEDEYAILFEYNKFKRAELARFAR